MTDIRLDTRVRTTLLASSGFVIVASVAAYFVLDLGQLQDRIAAREGRAALQGMTDASQLDEALRQHPQNKFLRMMAMATRAANDTNMAIEKLAGEIHPPEISQAGNLGAASRIDLEALRGNLATAEANAAAFMPRYSAVLKAERDNVEKYAASLHLERTPANDCWTASTSDMRKPRISFPGCCPHGPLFIAPIKTTSRFSSGNSVPIRSRAASLYSRSSARWTVIMSRPGPCIPPQSMSLNWTTKERSCCSRSRSAGGISFGMNEPETALPANFAAPTAKYPARRGRRCRRGRRSTGGRSRSC